MLTIKNLSVCVDEKQILKNINLTLKPGSTHIIMGPNGSGKSTLMYALMGHPKYCITQGSIFVDDQDITREPVEKRARNGIFLAFQNPYNVPGIKINTFLYASYTALTKEACDRIAFDEKLSSALRMVGLPESFAERYLHDGFSGGERKRLELAQLLILPSRIALLDELDSGLDADGLRSISLILDTIRQQRPQLIMVIITHYAQLAQTLLPEYVHIMIQGEIVKTSQHLLAHTICQKGYDEYLQR